MKYIYICINRGGLFCLGYYRHLARFPYDDAFHCPCAHCMNFIEFFFFILNMICSGSKNAKQKLADFLNRKIKKFCFCFRSLCVFEAWVIAIITNIDHYFTDNTRTNFLTDDIRNNFNVNTIKGKTNFSF